MAPGQVVPFPSRSFRTLTVTIDGTSAGIQKNYQSQSAVGFAEVTIPGVAPATEVLRLPTDLLQRGGDVVLADHPLDILLNRIRTQVTPPRSDPEASMARRFTLPTARTFSIGGTARISTLIPDTEVDALVGRTGGTSPTGGHQAGSGHRGVGQLVGAAPREPPVRRQRGRRRRSGHLVDPRARQPGRRLGGVPARADPRPSTTSTSRWWPTGGTRSPPPSPSAPRRAAGQVTLPAHPEGTGRPQGSVTPVPVSLPALTGSDVKVTIDSVAPHTFLDYLSNSTNTDPVALAEVGIPGAAPMVTPATVPTVCYADLVAVDGTPVDVSDQRLDLHGAGQRGPDHPRAAATPPRAITLSAGHPHLTTASYLADRAGTSTP